MIINHTRARSELAVQRPRRPVLPKSESEPVPWSRHRTAYWPTSARALFQRRSSTLSDSPFSRTSPERAKVVYPRVMTPLSSRCAMLIWMLE